jgi:hypothetical protein
MLARQEFSRRLKIPLKNPLENSAEYPLSPEKKIK